MYPRIFVSAVSAEFGTLRQKVSTILQRMGYEARSQDNFPTGYGELGDWLRQEIEQCDGLIQILGAAYGREPPNPFPEYVDKHGRVSYTQFELLHARALNKKVWIFKASDNVVRDTAIDELDGSGVTDPAVLDDPQQKKYREQQAKYIDHLRELNLLRHPFDSPVDLENRVLWIKDEMSALRDEYKQSQSNIKAIVQHLGISISAQTPPEQDIAAASPGNTLINRWSERLKATARAHQFRGHWCEALVNALRKRYTSFPSNDIDIYIVVQWFNECPIAHVEGLFSSIRAANKAVAELDGVARDWAVDFIVLAALRCISPARITGFDTGESSDSSTQAAVGQIATRSALIASIGIAGLLGQALIIDGGENPRHVMVVDNIEPLLEQDEAILRQLYDMLPLSAKLSPSQQSLSASHRFNPSNHLTEDEKGELWSYFRECFLDGHFAAVFLRVSAQPGPPHQRLAEKIATAIDSTVIQGATEHDEQLVIRETGFTVVRLRIEIMKRFAELGSNASATIDVGPRKDTRHVQSSQSTESRSIAASNSRSGSVKPVDQQALDAFLHGHEFHLFISHASEDKQNFVIPIVNELRRRGVRVWLDQDESMAGDSITHNIDLGLQKARFGLAVLSPSYFRKQWTQAELEALLHHQIQEQQLHLIPVLLDIDEQELSQHSRLVSSRLCLNANDGVEKVADGIVNVIRSRA